ncbi:hypothetical protein PHYBLDRAFT_146929 [Phycomyces blakesleeanus NRRL 1555(-)]|uniref:C2H2-type zinc finger transcription factor n=1 Tax=Phycomyces blakesleeanus (strain ATCC 8743b / DSM 1359 / FGSC 10004 / NBRC 33097 / NRRL 1555) TaxID=763407 RepID=A0A162PQD5_PHYB8|nr:hypothetical protein PHYBLDRAFT_146929 [Phycomyces blakesleeanus NRRL 1555(-)]OAD71946.1 hypothetical protein PHYBLDRAFT_146929 [Phycomyces blakesleeanus NRRL 1555(-)]|eukprot:XP_018289986.1 hypothetical protein PHYBLDRAFT_146929 [Phycomyces blakesleeanus NRRL 1555(-)]
MSNVCKSDIVSAHKYLENFCKECETLYTLDLISLNMHLHLHLQATICDFGPVYSYWLFSFERYNTSTITPYSQLSFSLANFITATLDVLISIKDNKPLLPTAFSLAKKPLSLIPTPEYNCLVDYYQVAYNNGMISSCKNDMTRQVYKGCNVNGRGFYIQALFEENRMNAHYGYIGEIQYIFVYLFIPTNSPTAPSNHNHEHIFAFVRWCKTTSDTRRQPKDIEIYHANFYNLDFQSILPIRCILLPVAIIDYKTRRSINRKIAIPLPQKIYT